MREVWVAVNRLGKFVGSARFEIPDSRSGFPDKARLARLAGSIWQEMIEVARDQCTLEEAGGPVVYMAVSMVGSAYWFMLKNEGFVPSNYTFPRGIPVIVPTGARRYGQDGWKICDTFIEGDVRKTDLRLAKEHGFCVKWMPVQASLSVYRAAPEKDAVQELPENWLSEETWAVVSRDGTRPIAVYKHQSNQWPSLADKVLPVAAMVWGILGQKEKDQNIWQDVGRPVAYLALSKQGTDTWYVVSNEDYHPGGCGARPASEIDGEEFYQGWSKVTTFRTDGGCKTDAETVCRKGDRVECLYRDYQRGFLFKTTVRAKRKVTNDEGVGQWVVVNRDGSRCIASYRKFGTPVAVAAEMWKALGHEKRNTLREVTPHGYGPAYFALSEVGSTQWHVIRRVPLADAPSIGECEHVFTRHEKRVTSVDASREPGFTVQCLADMGEKVERMLQDSWERKWQFNGQTMVFNQCENGAYSLSSAQVVNAMPKLMLAEETLDKLAALAEARGCVEVVTLSCCRACGSNAAIVAEDSTAIQVGTAPVRHAVRCSTCGMTGPAHVDSMKSGRLWNMMNGALTPRMFEGMMYGVGSPNR